MYETGLVHLLLRRADTCTEAEGWPPSTAAGTRSSRLWWPRGKETEEGSEEIKGEEGNK